MCSFSLFSTCWGGGIEVMMFCEIGKMDWLGGFLLRGDGWMDGWMGGWRE
jgi:hypothetical protein